jgi:Spy/CpxP family protein refolding chaperone
MAIAALGLALTVNADPGRGHGRGWHTGGDEDGAFGGVPPEKALKQLNLTADQQKKLKEIRDSSKGEVQGLRDSLKSLRKDLKDKMASSTATEDDIKKSFSSVQSKQIEIRQKVFDRMLQVRALLTPEQRKEMAQLVEKRFEKMREHRAGQAPSESKKGE